MTIIIITYSGDSGIDSWPEDRTIMVGSRGFLTPSWQTGDIKFTELITLRQGIWWIAMKAINPGSTVATL